MNLSNENRLLLYCAQVRIPEDRLNEAEDIVGLPLDWEEILESARWHGVAPLLYNNLKGIQKSRSIPQRVMDELRTDYNANLARNMYIYAELRNILGAFRKKGVEVILLKGAVLAKTIYGDIGLRPMSDVDLLVRKGDLPHAEKILSGLGYLFYGYNNTQEWIRENDYHIVYIHPSKNIPVEIHWHITKDSHPFRIRNIDTGIIETWWERAETAEISGNKVLMLCPEDLIFHLSHHFFKHRFVRHKGVFWNKGALIQLCDILQILKHYKDRIDWVRLISEAEKCGTDSIICTTLWIVRGILGDDDIVHDVLNRFASGSSDREIARLIEKRIIIREGTLPALPATLIRSKAEDRFQKKVRILLEQIFPHPENLSKKYSVPLSSKRLYFYYLIHPLNLVLKHKKIISESPRIREEVILRKWIEESGGTSRNL